MQDNKPGDIPVINYDRIYAYRRKDVLAGGLVWSWLAALLLMVAWVSDIKYVSNRPIAT